MKRYFQPVEKDGSAKNPAPSLSKKDGGDTEEISGDPTKNSKEPLKFVTWNANSPSSQERLARVHQFRLQFDPDIIVIQKLPCLVVPFRFKVCRNCVNCKEMLPTENSLVNLDKKASKHETDGRVILAEFEMLCFLITYAPNNGWKEEENSFPRRRKWDKRMLEFFTQSSDKPLIWSGDLNVNHEEIDISHPDFFSVAKLNGYAPPNKEDCGQPGFTLADRRRFANILKEGRLIDADTFLHKEKDMECGFSWSGHPIGKFLRKVIIAQ